MSGPSHILILDNDFLYDCVRAFSSDQIAGPEITENSNHSQGLELIFRFASLYPELQVVVTDAVKYEGTRQAEGVLDYYGENFRVVEESTLAIRDFFERIKSGKGGSISVLETQTSKGYLDGIRKLAPEHLPYKEIDWYAVQAYQRENPHFGDQSILEVMNCPEYGDVQVMVATNDGDLQKDVERGGGVALNILDFILLIERLGIQEEVGLKPGTSFAEVAAEYALAYIHDRSPDLARGMAATVRKDPKAIFTIKEKIPGIHGVHAFHAKSQDLLGPFRQMEDNRFGKQVDANTSVVSQAEPERPYDRLTDEQRAIVDAKIEKQMQTRMGRFLRNSPDMLAGARDKAATDLLEQIALQAEFGTPANLAGTEGMEPQGRAGHQRGHDDQPKR